MLIDGKKVSSELMNNLKIKISKLCKKPKLSIILIGNMENSLVYVKMKQKKCKEANINVVLHHLKESITLQEVIKLVKTLNKCKDTTGIMIQLPVPFKNYNQLLDVIDPQKDVDGLTSYSLGKLMTVKNIDIDNIDFFISSTVYGVIKLIKYYKIEIKCKNIVMIGNSTLVGMPLAVLLSKMGGTVDICHKHTVDLNSHTLDKDIIISCCGVKNIITGDMVKEGVIIFDIGINVEKVENKKIINGDCEWESLKDKVKMITPVPGGIGPMTIISLLEQTCKNLI